MNRLLYVLICLLALLIPTTALCWMNVVTVGGGTPPPTGGGGATIDDDFSSDSSSDYTSVQGTSTPNVTGGVALGTYTYNISAAVHDTSTGSSSHYVQAEVEYSTNCWSGLLFNVTPGATPDTTANGYQIEVTGTEVNIHGFSGGNIDNDNWLTIWDFAETWTAGDRHLIRIEASSGTLQLYIDWNDDLDFDDTGEDEGTTSDSTYSGAYVGLVFDHNDDVLTDCAIDNLEADSL